MKIKSKNLILIGFIFIFTRMFPKLEKLTNFTTGGLLRNIPILGVLILPFLYFGFSNLSELPAILVLLPLGGIINYTGRLIILTFFQFSFLALLFLYVIPRGFKLPKITKSFKDYTKVIGLSTVKPIAKNIFIGVISFAIYSFIIWIGANLLGEYTFDPSIIFRPPDPNLPGTASYGWFILVYMLIPGIWEEVAFRGVAIPMLQKKYTQTTTIVISGLVFGLAHSFNVILVILIGADPIVTLFQVIYATLFGFAFGYMFIKTKSLLPGMILHYTIDAFGLLFFPTLIEGVLLIGVYTIIFIGLIPSILIILLVKLFTWKNKRPFDERSEMRERHNNYLF